MIDKSIKTLIFDLGGVILDLSVDHTINAFSRLSGLLPGEVQKVFQSSPSFELYEKAALTDKQFREFVRTAYNCPAPDKEIDECWNAMLRGIPITKLRLLKRLRTSYQVILLSNTNGIHLRYINEIIMPALTGERSLASYFHKTYYSHNMGMRKPDAEIFMQVVNENKLIPEQTLFLDDNKMNVEGAKAVGIKAVYVDTPDFILEYFNEMVHAPSQLKG